MHELFNTFFKVGLALDGKEELAFDEGAIDHKESIQAATVPSYQCF
jgi:hypothetical protein